MESEAAYTVPPVQPAATDDRAAPRGCLQLSQSIATNERSLNLGGNILALLGNQREALLSTRQTLDASNAQTRRSERIVRGMIQRARSTNTLKLGVIVVL